MWPGTSYFCFLERWIGYWWQDDGKAPISFCFWMSGVACLVTPLQGKESEREEEERQKCHQCGGGGLFWKGLTRAIKACRLAGGRVLISKLRVERPKVLLLKSLGTVKFNENSPFYSPQILQHTHTHSYPQTGCTPFFSVCLWKQNQYCVVHKAPI